MPVVGVVLVARGSTQADTSCVEGCGWSVGNGRTASCTWCAPAVVHCRPNVASPDAFVAADALPTTDQPCAPVTATAAFATGAVCTTPLASTV